VDAGLRRRQCRPLDEVRASRDDIQQRVEALVAELDAATMPQPEHQSASG
jgi:hypothetical protein